MVYVVYEYDGTDRIMVCHELHEADLLLEQIAAAKDGSKAIGYMDDYHNIQLYKDENPSDFVPRIKKAAEDYISSHSRNEM